MFRAGAGYRYEFSDLLGVVAGLGLSGTYESVDIEPDYSAFSLSMYGRVAADVTFIDVLRVNVGLAVSKSLYARATVSYMGESDSSKLGGFSVAPFVGVSYVY